MDNTPLPVQSNVAILFSSHRRCTRILMTSNLPEPLQELLRRIPDPAGIPWDRFLGPALALALILILVLLWHLITRRRADPFPYTSRESLMTESELRFFAVLEEALADSLRIHSKVRLEDIIQVRAGTDPRTAFAARNRIKSRHIDFVLCDPDTLEILASVELDDRSHDRPDRMERDDFVDEALRVSGIPCIRFAVQDQYCPREIRGAIERWL